MKISPAKQRLRVAWLAPYALADLAPPLRLRRQSRYRHACSWIVNLSQALAARDDIELHLITESSTVAETQTIEQDRITFHVVRVGLPLVHRGFPNWLPLDLLSGFRWNCAALSRQLRKIQPDLVHGHGTETAYGLTALRAGNPCLISIQGIITEYMKTNPCFRFRVVQRLEQQQVRAGRFFTCRTDFDSGFVHRINPSARIFMIPEAMSPAYFEGQWELRDDPLILFVGSAAPRKGLPLLLRALPAVRERHQAVRLRVIGSAKTPALESLCNNLRVADCVEFLGFQPADEIARQHRRAQVFVLPSDNENSPNALAEAMVSGMPVIANRVGGIPSMVDHGDSGWLISPGEVKDLSEAISDLLSDPPRRAALGRRAAAVARARHWPTEVAAQTVAAYRAILADHGGGSH